MKLPRRNFLHLAAGAAGLPAVSRLARAETYPTRPVRIVVGFPAGGTSDIVARVLGQWLSERLGQQFIVENRPGASANLATEAVAKAAADGYTLLLLGGVNAINATLFDKLNFDFLRDIAPVAGVFETPLVVEVNPSVPDYVASTWYGFAAPKSTPSEIVSKLNAEINAALADPKMKARLAELGGAPFASSPATFAKFVANDTAKWAKVIREANIKPQ